MSLVQSDADILLVENIYMGGYELGRTDDDGVLRDDEGRAFSSGAYEVICTVGPCEACGNHDFDQFTVISGTEHVVCQACGHR